MAHEKKPWRRSLALKNAGRRVLRRRTGTDGRETVLECDGKGMDDEHAHKEESGPNGSNSGVPFPASTGTMHVDDGYASTGTVPNESSDEDDGYSSTGTQHASSDSDEDDQSVADPDPEGGGLGACMPHDQDDGNADNMSPEGLPNADNDAAAIPLSKNKHSHPLPVPLLLRSLPIPAGPLTGGRRRNGTGRGRRRWGGAAARDRGRERH